MESQKININRYWRFKVGYVPFACGTSDISDYQLTMTTNPNKFADYCAIGATVHWENL
jgi:hypothetical protein